MNLLPIVCKAAPAVAAAYDMREDVVGGSCSALVKRLAATGVKGFDGQTFPGRWGITQPILYIGAKRADDPAVTDEVTLSVTDARTNKGKGVCVVGDKLRYTFRAENHVSVIEWQHGRKPDSRCAKEWQRVRTIIRTHEPKHVQDIDATVAAANARVAQMPPLTTCGATRESAMASLGKAVHARIQQEVAAVKRELDAKARKRDVETAQINCKLCDQGASFRNVTLDCTIATPYCKLRTGQKLEGKTCGDPLKSNWVVTPQYFTEGCGAPEGNNKYNKPFDNDCVEAGSAEEKRRVEIHLAARKSGAGGWFCVYRDQPRPQITIRNFRSTMCAGAAEQTVTVDVAPADGCP